MWPIFAVALLWALSSTTASEIEAPQLRLIPLGEVTQGTADGLAALIETYIDLNELLSAASFSKRARKVMRSTFLTQHYEMEVTDVNHFADIHDLKGRKFITLVICVKSADNRLIYSIEIKAFYKKIKGSEKQVTTQPPKIKRYYYGEPVYVKNKTRLMELDQIEGTSAWDTGMAFRWLYLPKRPFSSAKPVIISDPEYIRNFSIIAHIDHGKSTLADRFLELTGYMVAGKQNQVLDTLQVERERGITVKAQTASMIHAVEGRPYLFNLIDTPGHADFSYEVSRSLAAVQGALLVVDAAAGVQAQTVSHYLRALDAGVKNIIPVINKVDLHVANVDMVIDQLENQLGIDVLSGPVHTISAKTGKGVLAIFDDIIRRIPPPPAKLSAPFKGLLIDSWFQPYRGAVCLVSVLDGSVKVGDPLQSAASGKQHLIEEIGLLQPGPTKCEMLSAGQVGYIIMGIKSATEARVGDTLFHPNQPVEAVPGFRPSRPTVYAGFFPAEKDEFEALQDAIEKLLLNDSSVHMSKATSAYLGTGWRLGFLGTLHLDVFKQRLEQEFNASLIATAPSVQYQASMKDGSSMEINSVDEYPEDVLKVKEFREPMSLVKLVFPSQHTGAVMNLCSEHRGGVPDISYLGGDRTKINVRMPLAELIGRLNDRLLSITAGYGSMDYEDDGWAPVDLVKVGIRLNGEPVDVLGSLQPSEKAPSFGKHWCAKLADLLPRQQFSIAVQAAVGPRIISRETVQAVRKDVTAKCYGGDKSRQSKLLEQQREGKKKMKRFGKVDVPHDAFLEIMRLDNT